MLPLDFPAGGYVSDYLGYWAIWLVLVVLTLVLFRLTRGVTGLRRRFAVLPMMLLTLVWTAVVAGETYFRYVYDETDSYGLMLTNHSWFRRHVHLNTDGFRDDEFAREKPPGTVRVACLGDSFTMGWGVKEPKDTFSGIMKAELEKRSPGRYDVRNYSIPGWTTGHEAAWVDQKAQLFEIDHIILGYCLNDPDDLLPPEMWFNRDTEPQCTIVDRGTSFLLDWIWFRLVLRNNPQVRGYFDYAKEAYDDPKIFGQQADRFRHIAETCRSLGIRLDVVVFPLFNMWGDKYPLDSCHERVVHAFSALGVQSVDLREAYKGIPGSELMTNRFDAHPNDRAHAIAAKVILEKLFGVK